MLLCLQSIAFQEPGHFCSNRRAKRHNARRVEVLLSTALSSSGFDHALLHHALLHHPYFILTSDDMGNPNLHSLAKFVFDGISFIPLCSTSRPGTVQERTISRKVALKGTDPRRFHLPYFTRKPQDGWSQETYGASTPNSRPKFKIPPRSPPLNITSSGLASPGSF